MLGVQKCWEIKNVGSTKMMGDQKCWEYKKIGLRNRARGLGLGCPRPSVAAQGHPATITNLPVH